MRNTRFARLSGLTTMLLFGLAPPAIPSAQTLPPQSGGRVYVVSPAGSDANAGAEAAPFRTIQRAADVVNPGDTVIVEDGTYTRSGSTPCVVCLSRGGTATSWVVFKSRNRHGARIDGQSGLAAEGFRFSGSADYIRVEGFDVFGMANDGSVSGFDLFSAGHDVQIVGNRIHRIGNH